MFVRRPPPANEKVYTFKASHAVLIYGQLGNVSLKNTVPDSPLISDQINGLPWKGRVV